MKYKQYRFGWFKTSNVEIFDLVKSWAVISLAFAIAFVGLKEELGFVFLISLVVVGTAFIFHELGHKLVAQRFKYMAEFRAFDKMLILALVMSLFGFVFAAPGAVMIRMRAFSMRKNGMISAAGPLMNIILACLFYLLFIFWSAPNFWMINSLSVATILIKVNAFIALFNLIPVWMFDGAKILKWNKFVYFALVLVSLSLMFL